MAAGKHTDKREESPPGDLISRDAVLAPAVFKVSFALRAAAFVATVITLSWFFQGWREINTEVTAPHVFTIFAGTALTLILLMVQGYWTYIEEKMKGTLRKRVGLYERIYERSALYKRINGASGEES